MKDEWGGKMIIRDATEKDSKELSEIYKYYVENFSYSFEYAAPSAEAFSEKIAAIAGQFPFLLCERDGEILGFAYAKPFKEREAYQWICETSIYAKNGCTQQGVGAMLYAKLVSALKKQGYVKAYAVLGCPNKGSEQFHQSMGFSLAATFADIGYKHGAWHDVKYYALELNRACDDMPKPIAYGEMK